ncbi:MAG: hypothetical protein HY861_02735 [Chlamydiia bacterium]|nr:hypothetical protein [Chlamydiia bacterium]
MELVSITRCCRVSGNPLFSVSLFGVTVAPSLNDLVNLGLTLVIAKTACRYQDSIRQMGRAAADYVPDWIQALPGDAASYLPSDLLAYLPSSAFLQEMARSLRDRVCSVVCPSA